MAESVHGYGRGNTKFCREGKAGAQAGERGGLGSFRGQWGDSLMQNLGPGVGDTQTLTRHTDQ